MTAKSEAQRVAYVFQGGGALGAYQVGVFQALQEQNYEPDWVIGASIGAINASIIAGNKPKHRLAKLKEFWHTVAKPVMPGFPINDEETRRFYNYLSSQQSLYLGVSGFFSPRMNSPLWATNSSPDELSYYSTDPLRETLENLIDFDILNSGKVRLSLSAVEVTCGCSIAFDNTIQTLDVRHILASGALPPGLPAVEIDGEYYWDQGILSNTPLTLLIEDCRKEMDTLCFTINLFDSYGLCPSNMDDVLKRHKDITYAGHMNYLLHAYRENHQLRRMIDIMYKKMPKKLQEDPEISKFAKAGSCKTLHLVRFLYNADVNELSSKDYEFSQLSIAERIDKGYEDGQLAIEDSPWKRPLSHDAGIAIHDIKKINYKSKEIDE